MRIAAILMFSVLFSQVSIAQKLVDPDKVAPEFRAAAEKRRAEQIKQIDCAHKADEAKVLPRDRMDFLQHCLSEHSEAAPNEELPFSPTDSFRSLGRRTE